MNSKQLMDLYLSIRNEVNDRIDENKARRDAAENLSEKIALTGQVIGAAEAMLTVSKAFKETHFELLTEDALTAKLIDMVADYNVTTSPAQRDEMIELAIALKQMRNRT